MAVPTNISPATAIDLTGLLPYAVTFTDLVDVPQGDPAYEPDCTNDLGHALWFKYTPPAGVTALGWSINPVGVESDIQPCLSVWQGTPPAITPINDELCLQSPGSFPFLTQLNVIPGVTYYFLLVDTNETEDVVSDLDIVVEVAPSVTVPAGTIVVANDTSGFPTVLIDPTTGAILRVVGLPAFEQACWLPSGIIALVAEAPDSALGVSVEIRDKDLNLLHTVTTPFPATFSAVSPLSNVGSTFYFLETNGSNVYILYTIETDGTVGATTWDLSTGVPFGSFCECLAISPDATIAYFGMSNNGSLSVSIAQWDLINDVALPDLVPPIFASHQTGSRDLLLIDGFLYIVIENWDGVGGPHRAVTKYDVADGSFVGRFTFLSQGSQSRIAATLTPGQLLLMSWPNGTSGSNVYFTTLQTSDMTQVGTALQVPLKNAFETGEPAYGPSQSCPLLIAPLEIVPPDGPCVSPVILVQPQSIAIVGGSTLLEVIATGAALTYQWYIGSSGDTGNPILGATDSTLLVSPSVTTAYWVRVTSGLCDTDSDTATVSVVPVAGCDVALPLASAPARSGCSAALPV